MAGSGLLETVGGVVNGVGAGLTAGSTSGVVQAGGAIGALRGPKHGGANEVALDIQKRYDNADEAEADIRERVANKEVVIGFGHPVTTSARPTPGCPWSAA